MSSMLLRKLRRSIRVLAVVWWYSLMRWENFWRPQRTTDRTFTYFKNSRSGLRVAIGGLIVVGILHQAFEEYAHRLSREMRDEWSKIQGRFVDLVVNASGEEQIDLLGRAIESDHPKKPGPLAKGVAQRNSTGRHRLTLRKCWKIAGRFIRLSPVC